MPMPVLINNPFEWLGWLFTAGLPYTVAWVIIGCLVLGYSQSDTVRAGKKIDEANVLFGLFLWPLLLPLYAIDRIARLTVMLEDRWAGKEGVAPRED